MRVTLVATGESARLTHLEEFERTQYLPPADLHALQMKRLRMLLMHAWRRCPFYRRRLDPSGPDISREGSQCQLRSIPILTKSDIQSNRDDLCSASMGIGQIEFDQTGGSTGQPISFGIDRSRRESRAAAVARHDRWAGWDFGQRKALVWGAPRDAPALTAKSRLRRKIFGEVLWLDTGNVNEQKMVAFHDQLRRFRPRTILAYAGAMNEVAQCYRALGIKPFSPSSIITSAEVLTDSARHTIEEVFQAPVFNRYGCREVGVIASECEYHTGMHVMAEGLYVEIVDEAGLPVAAGEEGDILVTDLLNYGMPLIRYRIGDRGRWADEPCKCGRGLPLLASVNGRVTEFVRGHDGRLVSGVFLATYVVAQRPSLGQVQIVQHKCGKIVFRIRPGREYQQHDAEYLQSATRRYVGPLPMEVELVPAIPREASGKLLFCKSDCL